MAQRFCLNVSSWYGNFLFLGCLSPIKLFLSALLFPHSFSIFDFLTLHSQPHHYHLLIHHWTTETLVILTDTLPTPVVALAKHNLALAVRIKVIFYLSLLATSLEVWPSKVEEPREQMWAPSPCQKQKTQTALNPASRKQLPVQWLRGRQQEKHFAALVNISLCTLLQLTAEQWCHLAFLLWKENGNVVRQYLLDIYNVHMCH